ncbi:MAG: mannose-1-phosphate guanylyltransferase [Leptospiraceae bacterium]|nr:mannose-1-phosphate guanylyltransferase [Leptospiraceae bacterium]MCB1199498.1 mannose-1-phosphate guanylyltransferase [Leptospiraceae bacterium]
MKAPYVLILAGGSGTRLWPLSRSDRPKQMLPMYSKNSLIAETYSRARELTSEKNIFIGTNGKLKKAIRKELGIDKKQFIIEPAARNTAPIIALFCSWLKHNEKDMQRPIVVLSADHYIEPVENWVSDVQSTFRYADERIWCLGVKPLRPDTGYGYIEIADQLEGNLYGITAFREKPDLATAQGYFHVGRYYWNTGMFIFTASLLRKQLKRTSPNILDIAERCVQNGVKECFPEMPDISFDYAVLEKSDNLGVVAGSFKWDDVGAFDSITRISEPDEAGNFAATSNGYQSIDAKGNILYTESKIALLGVENLVIAERDGVILIADRKSIGKIKLLREKFSRNDH